MAEISKLLNVFTWFATTGGPLILALTNTTAANGQQPLSSQPNQPLVQSGTRSTANLLANPMLPAVRTLLAQRGINGEHGLHVYPDLLIHL